MWSMRHTSHSELFIAIETITYSNLHIVIKPRLALMSELSCYRNYYHHTMWPIRFGTSAVLWIIIMYFSCVFVGPVRNVCGLLCALQAASSCTALFCSLSQSLCTSWQFHSPHWSWPSCLWWPSRCRRGTGSWSWPSSWAWLATSLHSSSYTSSLVRIASTNKPYAK